MTRANPEARMTAAQFREMQAAPKQSKFRNKRIEVDGVKYDSIGEAKRFQSLHILEEQGLIRGLRRQPRYDLYSSRGYKICTYVGDFEYREMCHDGTPGALVCEDFKGVRTPVYQLKIKWARAEFPDVEFREVRA